MERAKGSLLFFPEVAPRDEMFIRRRVDGDVLGDRGSTIACHRHDPGGPVSPDGHHVHQRDLPVLHERHHDDVSGQSGDRGGHRELRLAHANGVTHHQDHRL